MSNIKAEALCLKVQHLFNLKQIMAMCTITRD